MPSPVWRMTKAEVKYSSAEEKVYHLYDDCVSKCNIHYPNLEEDEVDNIGDNLLVIDNDGTPHSLKLCKQCKTRYWDEMFIGLISPWYKPMN